MPIHLIWGDDNDARESAINKLIKEIIDPVWMSINLSRIDGTVAEQSSQALEEVLTPPFGNGGRIVLVNQSTFCNNCSNELAQNLEQVIDLIPPQTHLILSSQTKPDGRLKITKILQKLTKSKQVIENSFLLPAVWDGLGKRSLVDRIASELGLELDAEAKTMLVEAIGNDSTKLRSELMKMAIYAQINSQQIKPESSKLIINSETVSALIESITTNALEIGNSLLAGKKSEAIALLDALLDSGEHALRIMATLTSQVRGCLWVSLLELQGEKNVAVIAKAAGINNPKRIYVMRKQIHGTPPERLIELLRILLEIETDLKKGVLPKDAFRDGLLKIVN